MTITVSLDIPRDWWLSSNQRLHHMAKGKRTAWIRSYAAAMVAGMPPLTGPVTITATICYPTARKADPPNAWPTVKAAIDGCVDSGLISDDNSKVVPRHSFVRGPDTKQAGLYRIELTLTPICDLCPFVGCDTCHHQGDLP